MITIYTDGASRGNPGKGGYGAILMYGSHVKKIAQGYLHTTNNRMELMAVIAAIEIIKKENQQITVYSDSKYVVEAVKQKWLDNWIKTNFKGGKKNQDLWRRYHALSKKHQIQFVWVKGHANNPYNNECDLLATTAADGNNLIEDSGYIESQENKPELFN
jgi:ribonuclease HI